MSIDWKYILKKVIIGVLIALILMLLKGQLLLKANAQVLYYRLYDSDYNLMYESDGTYSMNGTISPVRYARVVFDDPLAANNSYSLSTQFGLASGIDYAWVYWGNNSSGINVGGAYLTQQPTSATTSNQQQTGSTTYYKQSNFMFDFVPTSSTTSNWFVQLDFGSGRELRFFDLLNYTLINGGVSTNQDVINQTNNIINNQNINNQNVINNQNENTDRINDKIDDTFQSCHTSVNLFDKSSVGFNNSSYINSTGGLNSGGTSSVSNYIKVSSNTTYVLSGSSFNRVGFYSNNVYTSFISRVDGSNTFTTPPNTNYIRIQVLTSSLNIDTIQLQLGSTPTSYEPFGEEICINRLDEQNNSLNNINNSLTDDSINSNTGNDFFDNFNYGDDTLSAVITAPLRLFNKMTDTCQPIRLTWLNTNIDIPCGDTIFWNRQDVQSFRSFWNILFGGLALYYLGTKLYKVVHDAIDPQKDNIESVGV